MKMKHLIELDELKIANIRKLAKDNRQTLGFVGDTPIANDIFTILDKMSIYILEYPIRPEGSKSAFSATLMYSMEEGKELVFIGLNTSDYFDRQIFAIAHELYHYYTKTGSHLSRLCEEQSTIIEAEADRFAAEFLLPESTLESIVISEFKTKSLTKIQSKALLRFIARLYCTWWLPYRSIVKRLWEISVISEEQYKELYSLDERSLDEEFARIGQAINKDTFLKLNSPTNNIGTSPKDIEIIIRNFEDHIIDEDKFSLALELFNKKPDDFGYSLETFEDELDEFEEFFNREDNDEN